MGTFGSGNPRILGVAGGSLDNATFLRGKGDGTSTAAAGKKGELLTANALNKLAEPTDGPTILHDLRMPSGKYKANIDHVVVAGDKVFIVDAKNWKPGFYWTWHKKTRRGLEEFAPADKKTLEVARKLINGYLTSRGITGVVAEAYVVVWPSSVRKKLNLTFLRVPGARAISGPAFEKKAARLFGGTTANPAVVAALAELLLSKPAGSTPARTYAERVAGTFDPTDPTLKSTQRSSTPPPAPRPAPRFPGSPSADQFVEHPGSPYRATPGYFGDDPNGPASSNGSSSDARTGGWDPFSDVAPAPSEYPADQDGPF